MINSPEGRGVENDTLVEPLPSNAEVPPLATAIGPIEEEKGLSSAEGVTTEYADTLPDPVTCPASTTDAAAPTNDPVTGPAPTADATISPPEPVTDPAPTTTEPSTAVVPGLLAATSKATLEGGYGADVWSSKDPDALDDVGDHDWRGR